MLHGVNIFFPFFTCCVEFITAWSILQNTDMLNSSYTLYTTTLQSSSLNINIWGQSDEHYTVDNDLM